MNDKANGKVIIDVEMHTTTEKLLNKILDEQTKQTELLQVIASNSEQMIPAEVKIASYIADEFLKESANQDEAAY